ncbi:MAG: hypothetical protein JOZ47_02425 [Kutzneria sp.]|nr:hypothetical protein [Kutzneria sp.]MBV9843917.1 hypothetical protein [Kutzneria sp.]
MESSASQPENLDPAAAREALASAANARVRAVSRAAAPWWYHVGMGVFPGLGIASISLRGDFVTIGPIVGAIVAPAILTWALKRSTGISLNRYYATPGVRRLGGLYTTAFLLLFVAGLVVDIAVRTYWPLVLSGTLIGVLMITWGFHAERILHKELR